MNASSSILLVDDDPMILHMGRTLLTRAGYRVRTAEDGPTAIAAIRKEDPGILVTDWMMPGMTGIDLCRTLREMEREMGRHIYTIMLTALGEPDRLVEAFDAGADDYLSKPFHAQELVARVGAGARLVALKQRLDHKERELQKRNAELEVAYQKLTQANQQLDRMALTDELTGLMNRRAAMKTAGQRWDEVSELGGSMSCVMMDLDHFKSVNDTWGHEVGDDVLRATAAVLKATTRSGETVFRLGGEEFLLFCPNAGSCHAINGAERIRRQIEDMCVMSGTTRIPVTLSLGVAERRPDMHSLKDLIRAADDALYFAKHSGRNRVATFEESIAATDEPSDEAAVGSTEATLEPGTSDAIEYVDPTSTDLRKAG
ncbi:MAG: diguanylate cyclase [Phycisphaerales bacterium]